MILIQFNRWQQWFSWTLVQWMTEGNYMACSCTVAKWISRKSSPAPALSNSHWWYFVPLWFLRWHTNLKAPSYSWLKLTGAPWIAWVALQWWKAHAKYRHVQPIWTQSQHRTPSCTLIHLLKYLLTINGKLLAPPGNYMPAVPLLAQQTISNRPVIGSIPLLLLCTPPWNSCLHDSVVVYNFCMLLSWSLDFVLVSIYTMACNIKLTTDYLAAY